MTPRVRRDKLKREWIPAPMVIQPHRTIGARVFSAKRGLARVARDGGARGGAVVRHLEDGHEAVEVGEHERHVCVPLRHRHQVQVVVLGARAHTASRRGGRVVSTEAGGAHRDRSKKRRRAAGKQKAAETQSRMECVKRCTLGMLVMLGRCAPSEEGVYES